MRHRPVTYSSEATFQALADPTRRAVLDLLRQGSQPAGEIAQAFPVSRPAISKHLRLLRRAHLVRERREAPPPRLSTQSRTAARSELLA
ncbi:MAG: metalloregulator ArsR/SmtB family transcription factor [Candidatus Sulfotelmatobacter sp.]